MRNLVICCVALLALAGSACTRTEDPPGQLTVDLGGGVKLEMVLIPAGEFMMGCPSSDQDAVDAEKPQHRVRITRPFYLGKYPVTQEQWDAVMGGQATTGDDHHFKGLKNPVDTVSWQNCQEFLEQLNRRPGNPGEKFQLPTEAQWEYACRAGSSTKYCYGDEESRLGEYAWYDDNSEHKTHPVGEKKPNAWGLYDVHGNIWQWCEDRFGGGYYAKSPVDDPPGPAAGSDRALRGGAWGSYARSCRSSSRLALTPMYRDENLGFRVARAVAK
jgi:formylglycine-generating enzyme required for sulfatase activity